MAGESSSHVTTGARRLAAIMSADIVGFSRLMGKDEEGTHERMKRYRRDILEPTVSEHYGKIFKHTGDGFLAIFDSPLEAVRCAVVIQQTVAARNTAVAKDRWLQYRIGINLGDVIVEPDDIYGDGVNIAARLQTAAEPGGVNISGGAGQEQARLWIPIPRRRKAQKHYRPGAHLQGATRSSRFGAGSASEGFVAHRCCRRSDDYCCLFGWSVVFRDGGL